MIRFLVSLLVWSLQALFKSSGTLVIENLALRQQLAAYARCQKRVHVQPQERMFWAMLSKVWASWRVVERSGGLNVVGLMTCRVTVEGMAMSGFEEPSGAGFWHRGERLRLSGRHECLALHALWHHPVLTLGKVIVEQRQLVPTFDDAEEWWSFDHSSASSKDHDTPALEEIEYPHSDDLQHVCQV